MLCSWSGGTWTVVVVGCAGISVQPKPGQINMPIRRRQDRNTIASRHLESAGRPHNEYDMYTAHLFKMHTSMIVELIDVTVQC
jgi:hypothetical protein